MESLHPLFQPSVVPVHMLDVICAHDSFPYPVVHDLMRYPLSLAEAGIDPSAIAAEYRIRGYQRL